MIKVTLNDCDAVMALGKPSRPGKYDVAEIFSPPRVSRRRIVEDGATDGAWISS